MMSDRNKDPEQLEREVESARRRVDETVDALSYRLSPGQLLDQVLKAEKPYEITCQHPGLSQDLVSPEIQNTLACWERIGLDVRMTDGRLIVAVHRHLMEETEIKYIITLATRITSLVREQH